MIYGVSLGPGAADLITVRGLKILQAADKIYFPGSLFSNGRLSSYSLSILQQYDLDEDKFEGFYLNMDVARTHVEEVYETTFLKIKQDYLNNKTIAIVSEGDINTYSSFSYILDRIKKEQFSIALVPGITSYALAASEHLMPLCLQNQKLIILPRIQSSLELEEALTHFDTVILMKIKTVVAVINKVVTTGKYTLRYAEKLGTEDQFISANWSEISQREIPYFSLLIIKK